jgi:hypothetical protein
MKYVVRPGDSMASIAAAFGCGDPQGLFDASENAALKKKRKSPDLLHTDDEVEIPDRLQKLLVVQKPTGDVHKITVKVPTKKLRLVLQGHDGEGYAGEAYTLRYGQTSIEGALDGDGALDVDLPVNVHEAELELGGVTHRLMIGHLNPVADADSPDGGLSGAQARLANLGYYSGPIDGALSASTKAALRTFQGDQGLDVTGELDDDTVSALEDEHGC